MFRFKELIELWRSDNLLTQALNDSNLMLESTYEMFKASVTSLRESDGGSIEIDIYQKDQIVNKYEQEVRRKVLKHLAITGGVNIIPGLILTSIVIDIERIGDYTKNIMELALAHPKKLQAGSLETDVIKIETNAARLFEGVVPALKISDQKAAVRLLEESLWMIGKCDELLGTLTKTEVQTLGSPEAVSLALYVRYLKRVTAHLRNILSGIVNPFERIGFRKENGED
ncbi:MAG: PhoU domain-containing protein [Candidatus Latescibacterota bacterium]|nr:MAG: PhoU domain-containing protein [Candidatus Latescibacterota bacterium]